MVISMILSYNIIDIRFVLFGQRVRIFVLSEIKIACSVVVADIFHHLTHTHLFITCEWYETFLYVVSKEIAKSAAEIFVAWI